MAADATMAAAEPELLTVAPQVERACESDQECRIQELETQKLDWLSRQRVLEDEVVRLRETVTSMLSGK